MLNSPLKVRQTPRNSTGFTLIELLVVVAVIALLIGILLPALGAARKSAQKAQGANIQRQLVIGMIAFSNSNRGEVPGANTSARKFDNDTDTQELSESGEQPVTQWDWMSPSLDAADNPQSWDERVFYLFDNFQDPSMNEILQSSQVNSPGSNLPGIINDNGGMPTASFLMPASWQTAGASLASGTDPLIPQVTEEASVFQVPDTYRPRLDQFGGGARKVAIGDGVPGVSGGSFSLDLTLFQQGTVPLDNGFITLPPPLQPVNGAVAYDPQSDFNSLSYRQPGGTMNITRWDGSGGELTEQQSLDPSLWYPPNTLYVGGARPEVTSEYGYANGDFVN
jgi:prepilin-type N-terminal cleavage/methylation domain-containing protein